MSVLTDDLLARIHARAEGYDRDNAFFAEDLAELSAAGYLAPRPLLEVMRDQRRLAAAAPATALGIGMHLIVTGLARTLAERGEESLRWILEEAAAGEVFAFGNSEAGNDLVMWDARTRMERVEGGYAVTGTKIFTSLSPGWTRLSVFGREETADGPRLVHGVIARDGAGAAVEGLEIVEDWDTLGMRATQSHTTRLHGVVIPDARITRFLPVGPNADPYIFALFANFLLVVGAVYAGIADRALELAVEAAHRRTSMKNDGAPYSADPDIRWRVAEAALTLDGLRPELEGLARDVDEKADHGADWFRYLTGAKHRATEAARRVVDEAMRVAGGGAYRSSAELSRLQRDVLAGVYHPSDTESVHATVATRLLGPLP
ncbi:MAG: acyl-CoA/acyl-ACP dehydrogenase [Actinomycetales bacterium]|nr:acyl-CoA/acyl-ACP dehydrogenase [Actinomycetales bacterium]